MRWSIVGIIGAAIVVSLVLGLVILVPKPGYVQPPVRVTDKSLNETITWNESKNAPLSVGPYYATSLIIEDQTGVTSDLTLGVSLGAAQTPAGLQFLIYSNIKGNISQHLRPSSLTTVASDYPGNYSDPLIRADFLGSTGDPSINISYPQPAGYTGNAGFAGLGALVDSVGFSGVGNNSYRFFFVYPAWDAFFLAYPANHTTVYNTFHLSVELSGITPSVACEVTVNIANEFTSSKWR